MNTKVLPTKFPEEARKVHGYVDGLLRRIIAGLDLAGKQVIEPLSWDIVALPDTEKHKWGFILRKHFGERTPVVILKFDDLKDLTTRKMSDSAITIMLMNHASAQRMRVVEDAVRLAGQPPVASDTDEPVH